MTIELFYIFTTLQLADIYTTHAILKQGGREMNVVMKWLFDRIGHIPALLATKGIVVILVYLYLLPYEFVLGGLCVFYAVIVAHNLKQIDKP